MAAEAAKRKMSCLLLIGFFVVVLSGSASEAAASHGRTQLLADDMVLAAFDIVPLTLPADIPTALTNFTAGKGNFRNFLVDLFLGVGAQEYTYNGTAWVNTNVTAFLYNKNKTAVAHHFFIPPPGESGAVATWEKFDPPSRVTAGALVKIQKSGAVPLLLLASTFNTGGCATGGFGDVTHVQRLQTNLGLPPTEPGKKTGEIFFSPYSALYAFYNVPK